MGKTLIRTSSNFMQSIPFVAGAATNDTAIPGDRPDAAATPLRSADKGNHVPELDGLRGLAALCAVGYHYLFGPALAIPAVAVLNTVLEATPIALDTFFILSGFLIGGILLRSKDSPNYYRTFYLRRFHRILPLYYCWIAVYIVFFFAGKGWGLVAPAGYSTPFVFASFLLMFQNFFIAIVESTYIVSPTWTLAVEEQFYLLAPPCIKRLSQRRLIQALCGVILLAPVLRGFIIKFIGHAEFWSRVATRIWTPCHADALAIGVLLAMAWDSQEKRRWIQEHSRFLPLGMLLFTALGSVLLRLAYTNVPHTYVLTAAFAQTAMELSCLCLMVFVLTHPGSLLCKFLRSDTMRGVGKISYCLYLVHWGVLWIIVRFVLHTKFGSSPRLELAAAPFALAISFAIARLSWKFLESPLIRRAHRYSY
jgi:peptidoglycan/LPS O-acetylase OafA/YrhL